MSAGWIKLHRAAIEHPCLQKLDALGVWCALLMRAARTPKRVILSGLPITLQHGQLALPVSSFAEAGGVTRKRMRSIMGLFRANQMIEVGQAKGHAFTLITICNYSEWQGLIDSEGQAEGQDGAKLGPTKGQGRAKLGPTEQEGKKEEDSSLRSESHDEPAAGPAKRVRKVTLGSRIPADWPLSAENRKYARDRGFPDARIDRMHEEFVNHWLGVSGQKGLKADWDATWRNRVLQVLEFMNGPTGGGRPAEMQRRAVEPARRVAAVEKHNEAQRLKAAEDQVRAEGLHPMTSEGRARLVELMREAA
jgi:hypothetical protein